jgi:hypothetical protein
MHYNISRTDFERINTCWFLNLKQIPGAIIGLLANIPCTVATVLPLLGASVRACQRFARFCHLELNSCEPVSVLIIYIELLVLGGASVRASGRFASRSCICTSLWTSCIQEVHPCEPVGVLHQGGASVRACGRFAPRKCIRASLWAFCIKEAHPCEPVDVLHQGGASARACGRFARFCYFEVHPCEPVGVLYTVATWRCIRASLWAFYAILSLWRCIPCEPVGVLHAFATWMCIRASLWAFFIIELHPREPVSNITEFS